MNFLLKEADKRQLKLMLLLLGTTFLLITFFTESAFAVTVESLQAPIRGLKSEIFGGWMVVNCLCQKTLR